MLGRSDAVQGEIYSCLKRHLLLRGATAVSRSVPFPETTGTGFCIAEKQNVSTCLNFGLLQPDDLQPFPTGQLQTLLLC